MLGSLFVLFCFVACSLIICHLCRQRLIIFFCSIKCVLCRNLVRHCQPTSQGNQGYL